MGKDLRGQRGKGGSRGKYVIKTIKKKKDFSDLPLVASFTLLGLKKEAGHS